MRAEIKKWGNSRALRIPKEMALEIGLDFDTKVELRAVEGRLHVIPIEDFHYTLEDLIAGITLENRHGEWDTGPAVGKEVW